MSSGVQTIYPLSDTRIHECLSELELTYFLDSDGDFGVIWSTHIVSIIKKEGSPFMIVRGTWWRRCDISYRHDLMALVAENNATKIGPKAFLTVSDRGLMHVVAECALPVDAGLSDQQLIDFFRISLGLVQAFIDRIELAFPDPLNQPRPVL